MRGLGMRRTFAPPEPIPASDAVAVVVLIALEVVALWLVVRLWREPGRGFLARLFWSVVTLVPLLGLVAFAVWSDPPAPNGPTDRPR